MRDKILLIEGDASIIRFLSPSLDKNEYKVTEARNGIEGISLFMSDNSDLILLDLGSSDIDDSEMLRQTRSQDEVPILVVSARGQEKEKVEVLNLGADGYVVKPFHINELFVRIRVALRKKIPRVVKEKVFVLDGLRVDLEKYKIYVEDREVYLTPIESRLLVLLIGHAGKMLTHGFITHNTWGYNSCENSQSLCVLMASIRRKIEKDNSYPRYILTKVGIGYRFVDE